MQKLLFILLSFVVLAASTLATANQASSLGSIAMQDMHDNMVLCQGEESLCEQDVHQCCQLLAITSQHYVKESISPWKPTFASKVGDATGHSSPPIKPPRH